MRWLFAVAAAAWGCGDNVRFASSDAPVTSDPRSDAALAADAVSPDASSVTVTLTGIIGDTRSPLLFVAAQDGTGPWHALSSNDGIYTVDVARGRYGVAYVCVYDGVSTLNFRHDTTGEHTAFDLPCAGDLTGAVEVDVSHLSSTTQVVVGVDGRRCRATSITPTATCSGLHAGNRDVIVQTTDSNAITGFAIVRGVTVAAGTTTQVSLDARKDFAAPDATYFVQVTGGDQNDTFISAGAELATANGTFAQLSVFPPRLTPYVTVPPAQLIASDLYVGIATSGGSMPTHRRDVLHYQHTPGDIIIPLPDLITGSLRIATTSPYPLARVEIVPAEGAAQYAGALNQGSVQMVVRMTAAWAGTASPVVWQQPDFTALAGWDPTWQLALGSIVSWETDAIVADRDPFATPDATWDGATVVTSAVAGWVAP